MIISKKIFSKHFEGLVLEEIIVRSDSNSEIF